MSYSGYAESIQSKANSLNYVLINIYGLDFGGNWKSTAGLKLITSLDNVVNKITTEKENLQRFAGAVARIDELIAMDEKIEKLTIQLSGLNSNDENEKNTFTYVSSQLVTLKKERELLKNQINSELGNVGANSAENSSLHFYNNTANFDYICDIDELELRMKKCYVYNGNVADLYSDVQVNGLSEMNYVNNRLDSVLKSYKGREAAVNSALMSLMLAADKGVKYRYINSGSNGHNGVKYNTNEQMIDGMDCCAYVSWAVNKGTADPFHWEGVGGFRRNIGNEIEISQALPGDILVNDKHVAMIIANDSKNGQVTIVEAGGMRSDVHMVTLDYNKLRASFPSGTYPKAKSLEDYYTGAKSNAKIDV